MGTKTRVAFGCHGKTFALLLTASKLVRCLKLRAKRHTCRAPCLDSGPETLEADVLGDKVEPSDTSSVVVVLSNGRHHLQHRCLNGETACRIGRMPAHRSAFVQMQSTLFQSARIWWNQMIPDTERNANAASTRCRQGSYK